MHRRGHIFKETYKVEKALKGPPLAYEVVHTRLHKPLLVSLLIDCSDQEELTRDEAEARKDLVIATKDKISEAAALNSRALLTVVDTLSDEFGHYLVSERIEGLTLSELIERSLKPLDEDVVVGFARQLFELLNEIHEASPPFVLGHLHPDHIVVSPQGELKITDLGIHPRDDAADPDVYLAPERLGGNEIDGRADLYSLGAVLYFALTGHRLPPIWERITLKQPIPAPEEFKLKVSERTWKFVLWLLELSVADRPSCAAVGLQWVKGDQPEEVVSQVTAPNWYPERRGLTLADSYPYAPFEARDWILKMVQAAVVGRARGLEVKQDREECRLNFLFAAPDVPSPRALLDSLTSDAPPPTELLAELACGLRIVGEFRDFRLTLDDWEQSWTLHCEGGRIRSAPGESSGKSGLRLAVSYDQRKRVTQSVDELIRLERKTRLCPVPIVVDNRALEPGRPTAIKTDPEEVVELYLASASLRSDGDSYLSAGPDAQTGAPLTAFQPPDGKDISSHVDVRCYVRPESLGLDNLSDYRAYHFLRRPSRVLWYRRGVLCGWRSLEREFSLQFDIHLSGDHLEVNSSGLEADVSDWVGSSRLQAIQALKQVAPVLTETKVKVAEFWELQAGDATPKSNALVGMLGAPLVLLFLGNVVGSGFLLLKNAALAGLLKGSALVGGAVGYATATSELEQLRKTCMKAIEAFESEEL